MVVDVVSLLMMKMMSTTKYHDDDDNVDVQLRMDKIPLIAGYGWIVAREISRDM